MQMILYRVAEIYPGLPSHQKVHASAWEPSLSRVRAYAAKIAASSTAPSVFIQRSDNPRFERVRRPASEAGQTSPPGRLERETGQALRLVLDRRNRSLRFARPAD